MRHLSKILAVLGFIGICLTPGAYAEDVAIRIAGLDIIWPFKQVNASSLYDFKAGRGFVGAETNLIAKGDGALVFGGATSTAGDPAFPYVGINIRLPEAIFDTSNNELKFGAWYGRNFDTKANFYGLKGTIGLF